jgi:nucleoside 2-deoxyribosyltransferase
MNKIRIYLAGRAFETTYRKNVKFLYGKKFELIDPMIENGVYVDTDKMKINHNGTTVESIVETDKHLIDTCDVFVAYIDQYTAGTMMEILYAYQRQKPVYLIVTPGKNFENDIWLSYHSDNVFFKISDCYDRILLQLECHDQQEQLKI